MKILGVIPARYASTRFPGKPLVEINGKSMIGRVYEQAKKASTLSRVIVATDDLRIFHHIEKFGGAVMMTSTKHQNGTSRCHEVLTKIEKTNRGSQYDVVINIQGDEPYIKPSQIDKISGLFQNDKTEIATLVKKIDLSNELFDQNVVKIVFDNHMKAMYFSRQAIPFLREMDEIHWFEHHDFYKHIGIYGYRADVLKELVKLEAGKHEMAEKLEQLRWLENSYRITVDRTDFESIAVDTPEDLSKFNNKH